jgi:hypothetical protein
MPKHEIFHKPGNPVSEEVQWIIDKYFDSKQARQLERLGGRILISIATPYKRSAKNEININEEFISNLASKKGHSDSLKSLLGQSIDEAIEGSVSGNEPSDKI